MSITYMAKPSDEREGNSCHIHLGLHQDGGGNVFADGHERPTFNRFLGGQLAALRELDADVRPARELLQALRDRGSFAPTAVAWGHDNRTCSMRVVGHGQGPRVENRLPGADVNPYLALAAMIAAGPARGRQRARARARASRATPTSRTSRGVPHNTDDARDLFGSRARSRARRSARTWWTHYLNTARIEHRLSIEAAVTDWEKFRGFETTVGR